MDSDRMTMRAANGVNVDSHYILDGYDSNSWNRSTRASHSHRVRTQNIATPVRFGFGMGYYRHIAPPPSLPYYPTSIIGHQTRFLQLDEVALLVNRLINVRMETGNMSYEEFLALGEHVGNVSMGLSDEIIIAQMKTKYYIETGEENDCCVICQDEYRAREKIGILECGHEYHASCLRKWLQMKNICPLCKSEAFTIQ